MNFHLLSKSYTVKKIEEADILDVYHLCKKIHNITTIVHQRLH